MEILTYNRIDMMMFKHPDSQFQSLIATSQPVPLILTETLPHLMQLEAHASFHNMSQLLPVLMPGLLVDTQKVKQLKRRLNVIIYISPSA